MTSVLMPHSALLVVLAVWGLSCHTSMAQTDVYVEDITGFAKATTILSSAGCQRSKTEVCLFLNSSDQDHVVVQDAFASTDSSEPALKGTSIKHSTGLYNSTAKNVIPSADVSEIQRLFNYMYKVNFYCVVVLYLSIGGIGLISNILSGIILVRSGLGKPSNIFLLAMAVGDSFCLLGAANIAYLLMYFPKKFPFGTYLWEYSRSESFACFVFGVACRCLSVYGIYVSAALCTVVTIERLLAVYLPLHFINIVTPNRAWLVSLGCFLVWLPYLIFAGIKWYIFDYKFYPGWQMYAGQMLFNDKDSLNMILDYYVGAVFGKFIPLAFVIVGSVLIAIKVSITLRKRRKMVAASGKTSSSGSRTTSTLLVVCLTFTVTKIIGLPTYFYTPTTDVHQIMLWNAIGTLVNVAEYLNGGCNFFIYVFLNKKFRKVFLNMLSRKKR